MIFVFLGKKLISLDTILPVIAEVRSYNSKQRVVLIAPDKKTQDEIKKKYNSLPLYLLELSLHQAGWAKILWIFKIFSEVFLGCSPNSHMVDGVFW